MEITELISVYERLLPIYKKAYEKNLRYWDLYFNHLGRGICHASLNILGIKTFPTIKRYYKKYLDKKGFLFPPPKTGKDLKSRIDFMESEIKDLKRLIKKGYTHV